MTLWLRGHGYRFEMENICRLFLPQEKIRAVEERPEETEGVTAETGLERGETATRIVCRLRLDDFDETLVAEVDNTRADYRDACELQMATLLYQLFVRLFGYAQAWGIVTGVRPVKLLRRLILQDGEEAALRYFREALHESAIPVPGAHELLEQLHGRFLLCAASNGPYAQQVHRLELSDMRKYFDYLFISEKIGASKPSRAFYDAAFAELNAGRADLRHGGRAAVRHAHLLFPPPSG